MKTRLFQILWLLTILATALFACNFVTGIGEGLGGVVETAQSVATLAEAGEELAATGQALATQFGETGLEETALALATQFESSGLEETAQAAATELGESGLDETAQAFFTQQAPGMVETMQAAVGTQLPGLEATLQAVATQAGVGGGQAPQDIPVIEDEREAFSASDQYVTYTTGRPFAEVLTFYQAAMLEQGWAAVETGSLQTANSAVLNFEKPDRQATVILNDNPAEGRTVVAITIRPR